MISVREYSSKLRLNFIIHRLRAYLNKSIILEEVESPISGKIRIADLGSERSLTIEGATHSFITTGLNLYEINREYWGTLSLIPFTVAEKPDILMLGLGGGSALKLLQARLNPKSITVIEHDSVIIELAKKYFFVNNISDLTIHNIPASRIFELFGRENRKFDLIIDDVYNNENQINFIDQLKLIQQFRNLLTPEGIIILNRAVDNIKDIERINKLVLDIQTFDIDTIVKNIRQRWWNTIVYCRPKNSVNPGARK